MAFLDHISNLPLDLRVQILSKLPLKDAIRTGILSTRWMHFWTRVENILGVVYVDSLEEGKKVTDFMRYFDRVLRRCSCPYIKKFELRVYHDVGDYDGIGDEYFFENYPDYDEVPEVIGTWLLNVMRRNVEILILEYDPYKYVPPIWFYQCASLVKLELTGANISLSAPPFVIWPSLKSLSLTDVQCRDEEVAKILSGCPALESLSFHRCMFIHFLNITNPNLKELKVFDIWTFLEINAPWVRYLEIGGLFRGFDCRLVNMCSLVSVALSFEHMLCLPIKLLESIRHVDHLTLASWLIQVMSLLRLVGRPSPLFECKHLTVHSPLTKYELPGIVGILQASPYLEKFVMNVADPPMYHDQMGSFYWFLEQYCNVSCGDFLMIDELSLHLKNIEILHCKNSCSQQNLQGSHVGYLLLAEYLMRNASNLEQVLISYESMKCCNRLNDHTSGECSTGHARQNICDKCSTNCGFQFLSVLARKLFARYGDRIRTFGRQN